MFLVWLVIIRARMYVLLLLLFFRPKPIRAVQFIGTMAKVTFARGGKARGYGKCICLH